MNKHQSIAKITFTSEFTSSESNQWSLVMWNFTLRPASIHQTNVQWGTKQITMRDYRYVIHVFVHDFIRSQY